MRHTDFAARVACLAAASTLGVLFAQPSSTSPLAPYPNGPRRADPTWVALADLTAHTKPGEAIAHATIVYRDGRIVGVLAPDKGPDGKAGTGDDTPARLPLGPRVIVCTGLHAYAGFIDAAVGVDAPAPAGPPASQHWSPQVTPQRSALDGAGVDAGAAASLRKLGFAAAAIAPRTGVIRGSAAVVSLARPSDEATADKPPVYRRDVYQSIDFDTSAGGYPDSEMGAIALIRQTFIDADWQAAARSAGSFGEPANALDSLSPTPSAMRPSVASSLLCFNSDDVLESLRAAKIAAEFHRPAIILGSGTEYQRLPAIVAAGPLPHVVPLAFPRAPDVASVTKAESVELREMMAWEQAPTNPRRLAAAKVPFALTTAKLGNRDDFTANLRLAIQAGLAPDDALAALTTTPATILGVGDQLGTLEPGKRANIALFDKPIFQIKEGKGARLRDVIIDGEQHEIYTPPLDLAGEWDIALQMGPAPVGQAVPVGQVAAAPPPDVKRWLTISKDNKITVHRAGDAAEKAEKGDKSVEAQRVAVAANQLSFTFDHEPLDGTPGVFTATAVVLNDADARPASLSGMLLRATGERLNWTATRRPPGLEGFWPITFDQPDPNLGNSRVGPVLIFAADGSLQIFISPDAPTSAIPGATFDGKTLRYVVTPAPGADAIPVEAVADFTADPPTLRGSVNSKNGRFGFTAKRTKLEGTWRVTSFEGKAKDPADKDQLDIAIGKNSVTLTFSKKEGEPTVIKADDVKLDGPKVTFTHDLTKLGGEGKSSDVLVLKGDELVGVGTLADGSTHPYTAAPPKKDDEEEDSPARLKDLPEQLPTPFSPYGVAGYDAPASVIFRNATVWTGSGKPIERGVVAIANGKISFVGGKDGSPPTQENGDAPRTIDLDGKHLTAGVIDCHSHTGISRGVNEAGMAVTSQVRIGDVTNPDDVNWYRQLAAGVTAVNSLHGSANSIGGQNQVNKLRWGCAGPDDMHMEGAKPGIKFALGENPRRANRSERDNPRYPNTRMGVETQIRDRLTAAREYDAAMKAAAGAAPAGHAGAATPSAPPPRRDLQLEALAEILNGKRIIHCHSYRQDEIVMLCEVARDFGFKIGTFQHILEGYKVADFVRDYSGGGSGFTDWWAYKVEVQDAIPYGLPIMSMVGVTTSFNSDSNELARRLNSETAKAVKYGRQIGTISDWEAWNFVTLNPAKQLQIDKQTGSIEVGKDADLAVWSGNPMSSMSRCESTFVDGRELFSLASDAAMRDRVHKERQRLIQKLLTLDARKKKDGQPAAGSGGAPPEGRRRRRGGPPPQDERGVCGCGWDN